MKTITTIDCATPAIHPAMKADAPAGSLNAAATAAKGSKLPVPGPKTTEPVTRFQERPASSVQRAAAEAGKIIGDLDPMLKHPGKPAGKSILQQTGKALAGAAAKGKSIIEQLAGKVEKKAPEKAAAIKAVAAAKEEKKVGKSRVAHSEARRANAKTRAAAAAVEAAAKVAQAAVAVVEKTLTDASGGKAALRAAAAKAVAEAKVPVKKIATGAKGKAAGKTKKVALADAAVADVATTAKAPAAKKAAAKKAEKTGGYDWDAATAKAKAGTVPATPPFVSYGPHMQKAHDMAKAGQAAELRAYLGGFTSDPCPPSRKNLFRYGELCLTAVKAAAKK